MGDGVVEADENRELEKHRETAGEGVEPLTAIQLHDLSLLSDLVVLMASARRFDLRLKLAHRVHVPERRPRERNRQQLHPAREQDDRHAVVAGHAVDEPKGFEKRYGNEPEPAEVERATEIVPGRRQE